MGKLKIFFIRAVAVLNTFEGVVHLIVACIGFWGCWDLNVFDIRVLLPNIENTIFGVFSILTGFVIAKIMKKEKTGYQDEDRTYTNNERQLDTRIDCQVVQLETAYEKPLFEKVNGVSLILIKNNEKEN